MEVSTNNPLTVEQLLLVISVLFIPAIGCVYWLSSKLSSLEAELKAMKEIKTVEHEAVIGRVEKLERHIHDIRNVLQTLTLAMVSSGIHVDKKDLSS